VRVPLWQIDAFAERVFCGNPAAVCLLPAWPEDLLLGKIAAENNLAETAFLVLEGGGIRIRWFTPICEVELCGHATLASAYVYFKHLAPEAKEVLFRSLSGDLRVERVGELFVMDFPRQAPRACETPEGVVSALGKRPLETFIFQDHLAVLSSEEEVLGLEVDLREVQKLEGQGLIVTAACHRPGVDFVSRYFAPKVGIPEDPVTGSIHCLLVPFWAERLGKKRLVAEQVSRRGGRLFLEDLPSRVRIGGRAVEYLAGEVLVEL